jgi:hypothetical protein
LAATATAHAVSVSVVEGAHAMSVFVWVVLEQNGTPSRPVMLVSKPEFGPWNIDAVTKEAKLQFAARLQGLDADLLEVRETENGTALRADQPPPDTAQQFVSPLYMVDPRSGELFRFVLFECY